MPSKVLAKNSAEISFPRLHLNYKETKNTSLTSRLTSCKSKTVTHTFRFASPSGQLQQVAAGWCTRKWLRFDQTITNFTSGYLGVLLVVIQLGVTDILCQSDYLTNIFCKHFFSIYGACLANHFLTSIFTHTKLHQHVGLTSTFPTILLHFPLNTSHHLHLKYINFYCDTVIFVVLLSPVQKDLLLWCKEHLSYSIYYERYIF